METIEKIAADIARLKRELERTDLTAEQRADIQEEIQARGLDGVVLDAFDGPIGASTS